MEVATPNLLGWGNAGVDALGWDIFPTSAPSSCPIAHNAVSFQQWCNLIHRCPPGEGANICLVLLDSSSEYDTLHPAIHATNNFDASFRKNFYTLKILIHACVLSTEFR